MITISNWWGIFFSLVIPIGIMMYLCYLAGIQEEREVKMKKSVD